MKSNHRSFELGENVDLVINIDPCHTSDEITLYGDNQPIIRIYNKALIITIIPKNKDEEYKPFNICMTLEQTDGLIKGLKYQRRRLKRIK